MKSISIAQLKLVCQHAEELRAASVPENLAIRLVELFADIYATNHTNSPARPHRAENVSLWSIEARKLRAENPLARTADLFRVEHGTPSRAFGRLVLNLHAEDALSEASMAALVERHWRLAVITIAEDKRLTELGLRSSLFDTPEGRWAAADIAF